MKAKCKTGCNLLSTNSWSNLKDTIIINFVNKWTYIDFKQKENILKIYTTRGNIEITFTSDIPKLEYNNEKENQVVFKILQ